MDAFGPFFPGVRVVRDRALLRKDDSCPDFSPFQTSIEKLSNVCHLHGLDGKTGQDLSYPTRSGVTATPWALRIGLPAHADRAVIR